MEMPGDAVGRVGERIADGQQVAPITTDSYRALRLGGACVCRRRRAVLGCGLGVRKGTEWQSKGGGGKRGQKAKRLEAQGGQRASWIRGVCPLLQNTLAA